MGSIGSHARPHVVGWLFPPLIQINVITKIYFEPEIPVFNSLFLSTRWAAVGSNIHTTKNRTKT